MNILKCNVMLIYKELKYRDRSYSSMGGSMRSKRARRQDSIGRSYNRRRWLRRSEMQSQRRVQEKEQEWTSWRISPR